MAVEVTVRFAGTLIASVVVGPGRSFRLGTAPGVDVPIPGLISFPLIDSVGLIRIPAGYAAIRDDGVRLADIAPLALAGDTRLEIAIGRVAIELAVASRVALLRRPEVDRRPWPYLGLALVAHLAVWATAMTTSADPGGTPRRPVHARLVTPPPPLPPPRAIEGMPPDPGPMGKREGDRAEGQYAMRDASRDAPAGMMISAAQFHALVGDVDFGAAMSDLHPLYRDQGEGFGGAARFDPGARPGFESIKTGAYKTVSHGRGAGDDFQLAGEAKIDVELCATARCIASGAIDRASVHSWIAPHAEDFRACYDGTTSVLVDFTIADGVVRGARGRGATGACAAAVVSGIAFPHTGGTTRVRYEVIYRSS